MYKIIKIMHNDIEQTHIIQDRGNNEFTSFPADENNTHYQAYLKWLEQGNTPLPVEENNV
jgi:hypothetical protein